MCQIIENNNKLNLLPLIVDIRWYTIKKNIILKKPVEDETIP